MENKPLRYYSFAGGPTMMPHSVLSQLQSVFLNDPGKSRFIQNSGAPSSTSTLIPNNSNRFTPGLKIWSGRCSRYQRTIMSGSVQQVPTSSSVPFLSTCWLTESS